MTGPANPLDTEEIPSHRIIRREGRGLLENVHVGDFVELFVDGVFFQRVDRKHEKYVGYVVLIDRNMIGLSPSSPKNRFHGYLGTDETERKQVVVPIECRLVQEYRIY